MEKVTVKEIDILADRATNSEQPYLARVLQGMTAAMLSKRIERLYDFTRLFSVTELERSDSVKKGIRYPEGGE